jgi:hypothetical protein
MSSFPLNSSAAAAIIARRQEDWPELDISILEDKRGAVPPFPLDLLAQPWRDWVSDTASSAGAPADYVVQAVLAALAGLCGAGVAVCVTPAWSEPMVLWQAVVGEPSSGKSSALASMRRLLGSIEAERRAHDDVRVVVADTALETIAEIVSGNPRGVILWRDEPAWLAQLGEEGNDGGDRARWLEAWCAGGVTLKRRPDKSSLQPKSFPSHPPRHRRTGRRECWRRARISHGSSFTWPGPQPYCPLANGKKDDEALRMLRWLDRPAHARSAVPRSTGAAWKPSTASGRPARRPAQDRRAGGGLAGRWSTVARLAGALGSRLVGHRRTGSADHIGREQVEAAAALWTGISRRPRGSTVRAVGRASGKAGGALAEGRRAALCRARTSGAGRSVRQ